MRRGAVVLLFGRFLLFLFDMCARKKGRALDGGIAAMVL